MTPEAILHRLFDAAIDAALPSRIVPPHVPRSTTRKLVVIGAGKASAAMAEAVEAAYEGPLSGLVVTRYGHAAPCTRIEIVEAAHPVPDAAGAAAAARILELVEPLGADDDVLALISGGGSSLLTLLPDGLSASDAKALNAALLASGAPIDEMNCLRRHLSRIAGGRLAAAAYPARLTALLISDVPGDDPVNIASGPTVGDPTTLADARAIIASYQLDLPPAIHAALENPANESIKPDDPRLSRTETILIATPAASLAAASAVAQAAGLRVINQGDAIEGEARKMGASFAEQALAEQAKLQPGDTPLVMISGGETTVTLPRDGRKLGRGGRCVDFLLGLAERLNGAPGIWALAGDTDGVDGAAENAGALLRPETIAHAAQTGTRLEEALEAYDGHGFFESVGDQIITGPTLTNVNDFRAILVHPPELQSR